MEDTQVALVCSHSNCKGNLTPANAPGFKNSGLLRRITEPSIVMELDEREVKP